MIRIKAPRVWRSPSGYIFASVRMGAAPGRFITESMHRRVLALVRAAEQHDGLENVAGDVADALDALRAQAKKEAK